MSDISKIDDLSETGIVPKDTLEQFKALYYLIKAKRDTEVILFNKNKSFRRCDLLQLHDRVKDKLRLHTVLTNTVCVVVSLSNKEFKTFGTWESFVSYDWEIAESTQYISIEWDFNLLIPELQNQIPQTHTLKIRIGREIRPNEMIQVIFQGGDDTDLEEAASQVVCKIDFVNATICEELKGMMSRWYDGLPINSQEQKVVKFVVKNNQKVREFIILSFLTSCAILLNYIAHKFNFSNGDLVQKIFLFSSITIITFYIFYRSGGLFANRAIGHTVERFKKNPIFEFTNGDNNKITEVAAHNRKLVGKLSIDLVISIIANVIAWGLGELIVKLIK
jgi:hypothetical protein